MIFFYVNKIEITNQVLMPVILIAAALVMGLGNSSVNTVQTTDRTGSHFLHCLS